MFATDLLKVIIDVLLDFFSVFLTDAILNALGVGEE